MSKNVIVGSTAWKIPHGKTGTITVRLNKTGLKLLRKRHKLTLVLTVLTTTTHPPSDRVRIFYDESERLVRFLATTDKPSFLALLDSLARHQPFETILPRLYSGRFTNISALEENFREYASKDFGTVLQQANNL